VDKPTLLEFPCEFPIKAMGRMGAEFPDLVLALIREYAPEVTPDDLRSSASRNGNYQSVTITINASSRSQLNNIYRSLTACEAVLMAL